MPEPWLAGNAGACLIMVGLTPKPDRLDAADPAIIGAIAGALMML